MSKRYELSQKERDALARWLYHGTGAFVVNPASAKGNITFESVENGGAWILVPENDFQYQHSGQQSNTQIPVMTRRGLCACDLTTEGYVRLPPWVEDTVEDTVDERGWPLPLEAYATLGEERDKAFKAAIIAREERDKAVKESKRMRTQLQYEKSQNLTERLRDQELATLYARNTELEADNHRLRRQLADATSTINEVKRITKLLDND